MAPLVSFGGIASGLDTSSIIAALSAVNQKPIGLLEKKKAEFSTLKKRYEELNTKITTLRDKARALEKSKDFLAFSATSSNTSVMTVTANGSASPGSFNVTVNTLASAQVSTSNGFADFDTTSAGTGDIKFTVGGTLHTVTIAAGKESLEDIRDKINEGDIGVTATIVSEGTGATPYKLVLQSDETGTDHSFTTDLTSFTGSLAISTAQASANATLNVNGLSITRQSNTISDVVPGVTFTLVAPNPVPVTVALTADYKDIETKIQQYVDAHSDLVSFINNQIKAVNNKGGAFNGEATVRNIKNRLLSGIADGSYPGGSLKALADIGVKLQNDGTLTFDKTKFEGVAKLNLDGITGLMTKVGKHFDTDGFTLYETSSKLASGTYSAAITQAATKANGTAGATFANGGALTADEVLTFTQGSKTATVNLKLGDTLANALTKIDDALDDADVKISVTDSTGSLKFSASDYGSSGSFSVVSDTASGAGSTGVDTTALSATGLNAQGTIDGVALVGDGQKLTGGANTIYEGLEFRYTGTTAATSTLTIGADGFFVKLDDVLDKFLQATSGPVAARIEGLGDRMEDIDDRIASLEKRALQYEDILRRRFTALEQIMGRFQAQQSYLAALQVSGFQK